MANQAAARLAGDDYQHLIGWSYLLELLIPTRHLRSVTIEDPDAAFADDITMEYELEATRPDLFLQVKYHVDQRSQYSTDTFLDAKGKGRSLLRKFHDTWRALHSKSGRPLELQLVTNWTWDGTDRVCDCIQGTDCALSEAFFTASPESAVGKARERWRDHLAVENDEFRGFASSLRLRLGFDCTEELETRVAERMEHLGLRHDCAALLTGVGIVRNLVKARRRAQRRPDIEALLAQHNLYLPAGTAPATVVYLSTVKQQRFEVPPDHLLDWRGFFEGDEQKRGHRVFDRGAWNEKMLPELLALEEQLNTTSTVRLIRARGLARLSAWFAFGHTFSDVARYTIEVDQQGKLWRTDALPSGLGVLEHCREQIEGGDRSTVAVGISVTGSLEDDVRAGLQATRAATAVLFLRPDRELGRECLTSAADVAAFARGAKERMRAFVKEHGASRLLLFYFGPLSGACFLGHQLNAVAREIQIMEDQQPGYEPAFLLT
jgi:SMODS-associated and fused to various effectors sensor domain